MSSAKPTIRVNRVGMLAGWNYGAIRLSARVGRITYSGVIFLDCLERQGSQSSSRRASAAGAQPLWRNRDRHVVRSVVADVVAVRGEPDRVGARRRGPRQ